MNMPCIIDCYARIGCFELVYVKSLMKSQSHEIDRWGQQIWLKYNKLTTLGQYSCPMVQTRYLTESKTAL